VVVHAGGVGANENSSGCMRDQAWARAGTQGYSGTSHKPRVDGSRTWVQMGGCGQHASANVHWVHGQEGVDSMRALTSIGCRDGKARTAGGTHDQRHWQNKCEIL
jgi:hypothetical protein